MASITSIRSLVLDIPPSCIEFCPAAPDYFVVGTYFLDKSADEENAAGNEGEETESGEQKKTQTRTGSLVLFKIEGDEIIQIHAQKTPYAILDIHFSPHDPQQLAVAASTGLLQLFNLSPLSSTPLTSLSTLQLFPASTLILSLCWHPTEEKKLGITLSTGECCVISTSTGEKKQVTTHDLETWTLAFSHDGKNVFSGGDDAALKFTANIQDEEESVQWSDMRIHSAGVTAILPLRDEEGVLVTGSYDDHIRVVRAPLMGRRQVLAEENLEGGVWRLKMLREDAEAGKYVVLASCMHAGARIVELNKDAEGEWTVEVLARFEEHKSMNYGSDVQPGCGAEQTIISTSFYDKLLCLWRFTLP